MVSLKMGYEIAQASQGYENLMLTAQAIFGKGEGGGSTAGATELKTFDQLAAALKSMG